MAPNDTKGKKRKGAAESAPKPKKQKKSEDAVAATQKTAKALKAAVEPADAVPVNVNPPRKHAEDFFSDEDTAAANPPKGKKNKKSKATAAVNGTDKEVATVDGGAPETQDKPKKGKKGKNAEVEFVAPPAPAKTKKLKKAENPGIKETESGVMATEGKKSKKSKPAKKQNTEPKDDVAEDVSAEEGDGDDDQTAALLAGFESDRDESDLEKEDEEIDENVKPEITKSKRKALESAAKNVDEPGVVYLGRIPRGFYEKQMKGYFSQFGTITRLRLSRNKKTGASKHYAFIEFASAEVAEIVAKTMENYLMFNHILQCKVVPPAQVHPELFKQQKERFTVDPRNRKAGAAMARGAERAVWEKRVDRETKRRAGKSKMLKDEFDYEFTPPALKAVQDVPKQVSTVEDSVILQLPSEAGAGEVTELAQASESKPNQLSITQTVKVKKPRKGVKAKGDAEVEKQEVVEMISESRAKKERKRKADATIDTAANKGEVVGDEAVAKTKKAKKEAKANNAIEEEVMEGNQKAKPDQDGVKPKRAKKAKGTAS